MYGLHVPNIKVKCCRSLQLETLGLFDVLTTDFIVGPLKDLIVSAWNDNVDSVETVLEGPLGQMLEGQLGNVTEFDGENRSCEQG